ncbi:type IV secretory system conjugative DNA transfer family protein [Agrobacterium sp. NPDC090283]|uniref:type IV secretory system conjugative DNA transfer family protein n=1 Tax=Agrobacterium sp. NPDC090283 TaxID=3363920 RepID=UPI00383AF698
MSGLSPFTGLLGRVVLNAINKRKHQRTLSDLKSSDLYGDARFLTSNEIVDLDLTVESDSSANGILLGGQAAAGEVDLPVIYKGDRHLITLAPTRSGKGACHIIPNLILYPGSVFVIDVKGENFLATQRCRRGYGQVHVFAPYDDRLVSVGINPLDFVRKGTKDEFTDAQILASLILEDSGSDRDKFWEQEGRNLIAALIIFTLHNAPPADRNIGMIKRLLTLSPDKLDAMFQNMSMHPNSAVRAAGSSFFNMSDETRSSVLTTANNQMLCWAPGGVLDEATRKSDFSFQDLRKKGTSFFLIIPPDRLNECRSLLRIFSGMAVKTLSRAYPNPTDKSILFLLDEFANLGRMEEFENGLTILAGFKIQLWIIVQDLGQLEFLYKEKTRTIIANSGAFMAFNVQDLETAKHISEKLGQKTVVTETPSQRQASAFSVDVSTGHALHGRPLLSPDEVRRLGRHTQLIFIDDHRPIHGSKWYYFERPEFKSYYDDPRQLLAAATLPSSVIGVRSPKSALPHPARSSQGPSALRSPANGTP